MSDQKERLHLFDTTLRIRVGRSGVAASTRKTKRTVAEGRFDV